MIVAAESLNPEANLQWLLQDVHAAPPLPVTGIATDSRRLDAGNVFLAVKGLTGHGLDYLDDALSAGVAAVVWDSETGRLPQPQPNLEMVPVPGLQSRIGELADRWYGSPSADIKVAGITGTNGKTTVSFLVAQCMQMLNRSCAYAGTLGAGIDELHTGSGLTTPGCVELHGLLADFRSQHAEYAALEISSHALDQHRIDGVQIDTAVFTNLSRDHIDYHGNMRAYFDTKAALFLEHDVRRRIVNVDSEFGRELAEKVGVDVVIVSTDGNEYGSGEFVAVTGIDADHGGSAVSVRTSWGSGRLYVPLVGTFNVSNAMQVLAVLLGWQVPFEKACAAIEQCVAPAGRMQHVACDNGPAVYVDFAHTPAALDAALRALRPHCRGALWCVFGAGGDRDRGKRPQMGEVVAELADRAVVTSDNPRHELPDAIVADICAAMSGDETAIVDRATAIAYALATAESDDLILIAGKGHERYQQIGAERLPFSDYDVAQKTAAGRNPAGALR